MKPILLFGASGAGDAIEDLTKAQVKGHTRSDGTYVKPYTTSRTAVSHHQNKADEHKAAAAAAKTDNERSVHTRAMNLHLKAAAAPDNENMRNAADEMSTKIKAGSARAPSFNQDPKFYQAKEGRITKAVLLFGAKGASDAIEDLTKARVKGYTRSDGTFVQEHEDGRQAAQPKTPHIGANAKALRASSKPDHMDHWHNQHAADLMESGDHEVLSHHLRNMDTAARDHVLDHIHPDHWEGLGFQPLNKQNAIKKHDEKFGGSSGGAAKEKPKAEPKPKASKKADKAAKDASESLGALAEHHGSEGERHYKMAMEKGKDHPDHQHHIKASQLNNQAQYHLEQAQNAENDEDRNMHMGALKHVKGKLKEAESNLGS